jgi:hypothetical protein
MRKLLFLILILAVNVANSKDIADTTRTESDSTKHPLKVSGDVSLNSNGIAPIPAFALGKPTVMANIILTKNRFSYNPQLSYGLNFKPWIIDNWFRYKMIVKPKFELRVGLDISMFFSEYETPDDEVWRGQRWIALELAGLYKFTKTSSLGLMIWYDKGLEEGTISGYFINFVADKTDIRICKNILMGINIQAFYINYTDNNDGFFISPKVSFSLKKPSFFIFGQLIQPLTSNIDPYPDFQWNIGIGYKF